MVSTCEVAASDGVQAAVDGLVRWLVHLDSLSLAAAYTRRSTRTHPPTRPPACLTCAGMQQHDTHPSTHPPVVIRPLPHSSHIRG